LPSSWPTNTLPSPKPTPRLVQPQHTTSFVSSSLASYDQRISPLSTLIANTSSAPVTM
jgi:hypothetical protein